MIADVLMNYKQTITQTQLIKLPETVKSPSTTKTASNTQSNNQKHNLQPITSIVGIFIVFGDIPKLTYHPPITPNHKLQLQT